MGQLTLLLAFHNHQPDGNFEHVFSQGYDDCYSRLLQALADFPRVRCALHHTGALLEWIQKNRPEYIAQLRMLVERGQVEIMGGGFYEPMLAVLPERDAVGQIQMMNDWSVEHLGVKPQGMWLAERVWEPALAQTIGKTGLRYTLTDDTHFRYAGWLGELSGYYVTEKAGTPLAIFPIAKELRYAIPFKTPEATMQVLGELADRAGSGRICATYGDDGEKFGMWPGTKEWVWDKGWLRTFFRLLSEAPPDRIICSTPSDAMRDFAPTGRVYLPTASYAEMGEWALPADAQATYHKAVVELEHNPGLNERLGGFVRGGLWQNFLAKYPEANFMHKKMILVSDKLGRAAGVSDHGDFDRIKEARQELYRAQTNCGYWHGLFGGLYLNYIRHAVYSHLIGAEEIVDGVLGREARASVGQSDLDADLRDEIELQSPELRVYVKPDEGGGVYELDVRRKRMNLLNVLGRRREAYHEKLRTALDGGGDSGGSEPKSIHDLVVVKDRTLGELLTYDRHLRLAFVDHFYPPNVPLAELARGSYQELGDFAAGRYDIIASGVTGEQAWVELRRVGAVGTVPVTIDKRIAVEGGRLSAHYRISAPARAELSFASEVALTMLAGNDPGRQYHLLPGSEGELGPAHLASVGELPRAPGIRMTDDWLKLSVTIGVTPPARICRFPLDTASQSEGGFERTYQGSIVVPIWRASVGPDAPFECTVALDTADL